MASNSRPPIPLGVHPAITDAVLRIVGLREAAKSDATLARYVRGLTVWGDAIYADEARYIDDNWEGFESFIQSRMLDGWIIRGQ